MSEMDENADNLHNKGGQTLKFSLKFDRTTEHVFIACVYAIRTVTLL